MIKFTQNKKFIYVEIEGVELPDTAIKCDSTNQDEVLKVCQTWLDAFGLTDREYQVMIRIH